MVLSFKKEIFLLLLFVFTKKRIDIIVALTSRRNPLVRRQHPPGGFGCLVLYEQRLAEAVSSDAPSVG